MDKRKLPGTNIEVSPIVYGAFAIGGWFWGGADESDAIAAMETALDAGVNAIDTAPIYGMGHSEDLVAKILKGRRDKVVVFTKFGMRWDMTEGVFAFDTKDNAGNPLKVYKFNGKSSILEECERSLKRLQTDYIDLYQMHWPDSSTPIGETMEALELLLQQGKIRAAGVCNCPKPLLEEALKTLQLSTNQVAYSMVNRQIEAELVPYCIEHKVGILPHTVLQKGLLAGKIKPGHQFGEGDHRAANPYFKPENIEKIDRTLTSLEPLARGKGATVAQLAVNWAMSQPGVTAVLVGARNAEQVRDNVGAMSFQLTAEEQKLIGKTLDAMNLAL